MAVVKCAECGNEVSTTAKACPKCGAAPKKDTGSIGVAVAAIVAVLVVKCAWDSNSSSDQAAASQKPAATSSDLGSSARYVCKDFITRSGYQVTDFGAWHSWTTTRNDDGSWSVGARLMAAPPGGGAKNLYLTCVVKNNGGDNWSLVTLSRMQ